MNNQDFGCHIDKIAFLNIDRDIRAIKHGWKLLIKEAFQRARIGSEIFVKFLEVSENGVVLKLFAQKFEFFCEILFP